MSQPHVAADEIRTLFSRALSEMYRAEVPQYGQLLDLVANVNVTVMHDDKALAERLRRADQVGRLGVERHGAIRLGSARELSTMRRLFAVMGMLPTGYYDLSAAGVPVHSTAFRPIDDAALRRNPFRVFTSLLRLDLVEDASLREAAAKILAARRIFTPRCETLIDQAERDGGLSAAAAREFVSEALETFRWHSEAQVDFHTYRGLKAAHPLIADVVCFKGPHINHLTPRVLDIDEAHQGMLQRGMRAKATIEGPPKRRCPILLRQTSFLALEEQIRFQGSVHADGTHTARFGEIEQRGCALTPKGRRLYDELLDGARREIDSRREPLGAQQQAAVLARHFEAFPDDLATMHREQLAFVRYVPNAHPPVPFNQLPLDASVDDLLATGWLAIEPMTYEDFLPVSAAGIFQSNLGDDGKQRYASGANLAAFEAALGCAVQDEFELYREAEAESLRACLRDLPGLG